MPFLCLHYARKKLAENEERGWITVRLITSRVLSLESLLNYLLFFKLISTTIPGSALRPANRIDAEIISCRQRSTGIHCRRSAAELKSISIRTTIYRICPYKIGRRQAGILETRIRSGSRSFPACNGCRCIGVASILYYRRSITMIVGVVDMAC